MDGHTATVGGSRPTHLKETQNTNNSTAPPDQATTSVSGPGLGSALREPEGSSTPTSEWVNMPWKVERFIKRVPTRVDTQSVYCMVNSAVACELGLKTYPVTRPITLQGFGGGEEAPKKWAVVRAGCPDIGLEPVDIAAYLVPSKAVPGLLIGTMIMDKYDILEKIVKTKAKYAVPRPEMFRDPITDTWVNVVDSVQGRDDEKQNEEVKSEEGDNDTDKKKKQEKKADQEWKSVGSTSSTAGPISPSHFPLPVSSPPAVPSPPPHDILTTSRATSPSDRSSVPPAGPIPHSDSGYGSPSPFHAGLVPPQGHNSPLPRPTWSPGRPVHPFRPIPPSCAGSPSGVRAGSPSRMGSHSPSAVSNTGNGREKEK